VQFTSLSSGRVIASRVRKRGLGGWELEGTRRSKSGDSKLRCELVVMVGDCANKGQRLEGREEVTGAERSKTGGREGIGKSRY